MDSIRSLYVEMLEELELFGWDDTYSNGLQQRAAAALEHADNTNQPWPVLTPDQPPAAAWKQLTANREAALSYLIQIGILDDSGCLTSDYSNLE